MNAINPEIQATIACVNFANCGSHFVGLAEGTQTKVQGTGYGVHGTWYRNKVRGTKWYSKVQRGARSCVLAPGCLRLLSCKRGTNKERSLNLPSLQVFPSSDFQSRSSLHGRHIKGFAREKNPFKMVQKRTNQTFYLLHKRLITLARVQFRETQPRPSRKNAACHISRPACHS
jgi:hypothetical protein